MNESVENPIRYYDHNVKGTVNLAIAMRDNGCKNMVFSSSCTVYGEPQYVPIDEKHPLKSVNPYGRTKLMIEEIFRDIAASDPTWRIILLRYFNPVGAHPSGAWGGGGRGGCVCVGGGRDAVLTRAGGRFLLAQPAASDLRPSCFPSPTHPPLTHPPTPPPRPAGRIGEHQVMLNNLMPWVQAVALGHRPVLNVYGTDYPSTRDGTCVRDYIHVMDLADGGWAGGRGWGGGWVGGGFMGWVWNGAAG